MSRLERILHVVTYMGRGGLETMIMNYYRNINRDKVQFDFLVHRDFKADYDDEILSLGGKIYRVPQLNPFSFEYYKALDTFFKEHKEYKIVHVHQDCMSSIALKIAKKNNVPVRIGHSHSSSQDKNIKYLLKLFFMKSIPTYATHLFACGKEAGDWMFSGAKYEVLNNAIDSNKFKFNKELSIQLKDKYQLQDKLVIGHVGRFNYPKNHEFLINVFNELHKLNSNSKLILIGTGDLEESMKEKVRELSLGSFVMFMGLREDIHELMQMMDVFVFPSHYEGLGIVAIEAQASGLPIIKSNNVPDQCIMTNNVYSLSLNESASVWANKILNVYKSFERKDTTQDIKDARFDISENALKLQEFYLGEVSKYE